MINDIIVIELQYQWNVQVRDGLLLCCRYDRDIYIHYHDYDWFVLLLDDCHLQCHYGRKVDANGAELCECLKDSEERLNQGDVDTESTSASSEEKEDVKFVTNVEQDVNDVTSRCPEVKCSRLCPHGFQVHPHISWTLIYHLLMYCIFNCY